MNRKSEMRDWQTLPCALFDHQNGRPQAIDRLDRREHLVLYEWSKAN
jgi:hypothetical protein